MQESTLQGSPFWLVDYNYHGICTNGKNELISNTHNAFCICTADHQHIFNAVPCSCFLIKGLTFIQLNIYIEAEVHSFYLFHSAKKSLKIYEVI